MNVGNGKNGNGNGSIRGIDPQATGVKPPLRCAIYTRKSTDENLDSDFNSLDAQREAGENYIKSQAQEGWSALPDRYDDGAYSGATMERPALQRLVADIEKGRIDILVVYKLDRLSRSLLDFAKLIEYLEQHKVTLVSVTQSINTKDSSGRLLLNILLSYAQFEREVITERIRDKVAAAKRRGKWMGGTPPLGYDIDRPNKRLVINNDELPLVRHIFRRFLQLGSATALIQELNSKGVRTKAWITVKGEKRNGVPWNKSHIYRLLNNPVYIGRVQHRDKTFPGEHEAIIEQSLWDEVQKKLEEGSRAKGNRSRRKTEALLSGLLRCGHCGTSMGVTFTKKNGRTYRYYLCLKANKSGYDACPVKAVAAGEIENAVLQPLRSVFCSPDMVAQTHRCIERAERESRERLAGEKERLEGELTVIKASAARLLQNETSFAREELEKLEAQRNELETNQRAVTAELDDLTDLPATLADVSRELSTLDHIWEHLFPAERERIMKLLVDGVTVFEDRIEVAMKPEGLCAVANELHIQTDGEQPVDQTQSQKWMGKLKDGPLKSRITHFNPVSPRLLEQDGRLVLVIPMMLKRRGGRKEIILPQGLDGLAGLHDSPVQRPLVLALARAHQWKEHLESGRFATLGELAHAVRLDRAYVGRVLNLTLLAPDIVKAILNGQEPSGLSLEKLVRPMPGEWAEQRALLG